MINVKMLDAVSGQPASRIRFRGWMGFAVHAAACVALLFAGPLPSAEAQTWNTTTGSWQTPSNWNGGVPSSTSGTAVFQGANQLFLATGTATPSIGQLYFDNSGTTTLQVNRITLNSGTGIVLTANSGNVFVSNTSAGSTTTVSAVIIGTNQIWENNSTSGTLSVQETSANTWIRLNNSLTISGSGRTQLGRLIGPGSITKEGTGTLQVRTTDTSNIGTTTVSAGTLQIGDGINAAVSYTSPSITNNAAVIFDIVAGASGTTTYSGAISGNGTLTKRGAGLLILNGLNNAFTGTTTVSSGTLQFDRRVADSGFGEFAGDIVNNATVQFGQGGQNISGTYAGVISGNGVLTKSGAGKLTLTGENTFTGTTNIGGGSLDIGNGGTSGSVAGNIAFVGSSMALTFNRSDDLTYGGTISAFGDNFHSNTVTKLGSGKLTFTGSSNVGGTGGSSFTVTVSNGVLEIGNGGTAGSITRNITNNATVVFNRSDDVTYAQTMSGTGNLTKLGSNTLTLNSVSLSGTTTVSGGGITLGNNVALQNSGIDTAGSGTITASTNQTGGITIGGLIGSKNFSSVFTTNLTGITSLTLQPQAGRSFSYSGVIENRGSNLALIKTGPGEQILTGLNTFSGAVTISQGTLTVDNIGNRGSNSPLGTSGTITFNSASAGILRYTGAGETTNRFFNLPNVANGTGGIENNGTGPLVISSTITGLIGTNTRLFRLMGTNSGTNQIVSISGTNVSVEKSGTGTWWLTGASTYTGTTTVSKGTLQIGNGGNINTSSGVTVNGVGAEFRYNSATALNKPLTLTQGILSGTGTINTAVTVGSNATISPGNSPGSQTYTSSEWLQDGTYKWEIKDLSGAAGTNWDKVVVTNLLDLTGLSASSKFNINLTTLTGSDTNGPLNSPYVSGPTYIFPFVDFGSLSVGGTFSNSANSDLTALFNFNLGNWLGTPKPEAKDISVKVNSGGTGLNLVIVPEPATIALAGIGIGTAVWFFRRRRAA